LLSGQLQAFGFQSRYSLFSRIDLRVLVSGLGQQRVQILGADPRAPVELHQRDIPVAGRPRRSPSRQICAAAETRRPELGKTLSIEPCFCALQFLESSSRIDS
jgi:hypothetical protein